MINQNSAPEKDHLLVVEGGSFNAEPLIARLRQFGYEVAGCIAASSAPFVSGPEIIPQLVIFWIWAGLVVYQATWNTGLLLVGHLALLASFIQLSGYGLGLLVELFVKWSRA